MPPRNVSGLHQTIQQSLSQQINLQAVALGRLLAMNTPEFEDAVRRELDDNPALEIADSDIDRTENDTGADTSGEQYYSDDTSGDDDGDDDDFMPSDGYGSGVEAASYTADDYRSIADIVMERLSAEYKLSDSDAVIARYFAGSLDDNGYLTRPPADIADDIAIAQGFEPDPARVRAIYHALRTLDPAGIGATDLRDCMLLQLDRLPADAPGVADASDIVKNHYDLLSKLHYDRLMTRTGLSRRQLEQAFHVIRSLNPKPASALGTVTTTDRVQHVTPDYILSYDAIDDRFTLSLNGIVPELQIEESFRTDSVPDGDTAAFIRSKRTAARQFIRLVELRALTLMAIGRAIVSRQRDFFTTGDKAMIRPMVLRDIQADTGFDLSVISRATSGKYILAPTGTYPLKMLFNEHRQDDTDLSTHRILQVLRQAISAEDKRSPLSDQALSDLLAEQGFDVARRTVAKYRQQLGYPVARLRRQL